ncbi:acetyltransferase [Oceaniferula spumae]|uniref:Acetyltransferase n=1 Tax=Oceaniferula spumae TaxID=2979115 RepID=A0AAT9FP07_9BACT
MRSLFLILSACFLGLVCACSPSATTHQLTPAKNGEYVILLHGLARSPKSMEPLAKELQAAGYGTCNTGYPSTKNTVEELSKTSMHEAIDRCQKMGARKIHFVGHSMGAMLARYQLANDPPPEAGKLVQLAPPNQGSEVVDRLWEWPIFLLINGPAGVSLGTGTDSLAAKLPPVTHPTLVVAGYCSINPLNSRMIPRPDDGKVSVEKTKVEGMSRHILIKTSHPMIMRNPRVMKEAVSFLRRK